MLYIFFIYLLYIAIKLLVSLAKTGRKAVICTIHQPSSEIFFLFDNLLLLAGGEVVYFGSIANSLTFFSKLNFNLPEVVSTQY